MQLSWCTCTEEWAQPDIVDIFFYLSYNPIMKRFLLILSIFILCANTALAEVDLNEQAKLLYADNNITGSFDLLLSIPEDERTAQNWLLLGNVLQDKGRSNDAIFMYNQAILKDPKYYKAYYNLGNVYLEDEKPNLAIQQYKKVLKLKNDHAYAYYNLGCAYIKIGKMKSARLAFLNAIDFKNNIADFHYNLAYVYKKLNDEKKANLYLKYYNQIIENNLQ